MSGTEAMPFWIGGGLLGLVAVLHLVWTDRFLSVSGILARMLRWRQDEADREHEIALESGELDQALLEATIAQFGPEAAELLARPETRESRTSCGASPHVRLPVGAGALFLVSLAFGGALSTLLDSTWRFDWTLGAGFDTLVSDPLSRLLLPLVGGLLVGFGARMAGGCTSSHGLSGCARLQSGSLAATVAFFLGGAATAFTLGAIR